jgi:hypothetical protein
MNSVQFGRWLSERRRTCGWPSQRLLAESAQRHTLLHQSGISEDFLSRLEAGHLAYPFRGTVRRRILLLSWLLCKTPRDLKAYLKASGIGDFSDEEQNQLQLLNEHLSAQQTPPLLLLPSRPARLKGREKEMAQLMQALSEPGAQLIAITGMIGTGKSALAHEALHRLASAENEHLRRFPDGIATFACTGRQGIHGLISLLTEITALFTASAQGLHGSAQKRSRRVRGQASINSISLESPEVELASAMDRARAALANKRVLLLLDDLEPSFPLRQALDVLLAQTLHLSHEQQAEGGREQRVILTTSQFVPAPALVSTRLHLQTLPEEAALELLTELIGEELNASDFAHARQACAAIGYLPLAIESMATAVETKGIPLALVSTYLTTSPLRGLLDTAEEALVLREKALRLLDQEMREHYILLAALGLRIFDLETAAAVTSPLWLPLPTDETNERVTRPTANPGRTEEKAKLSHLANTAAVLGQCVRSSLLELSAIKQTDSVNTAAAEKAVGRSISYEMHPLLYAYAREHTSALTTERLEMARHNLLSHAMTYATRYERDISTLERNEVQTVVRAGLELAWNEKRYEIVVSLAQKLIPLSRRMGGSEGERILQKGLSASQQLHDQQAIVSFRDHLASLHCYHGDLFKARQSREAAEEAIEAGAPHFQQKTRTLLLKI